MESDLIGRIIGLYPAISSLNMSNIFTPPICIQKQSYPPLLGLAMACKLSKQLLIDFFLIDYKYIAR